MHGERGNNAAMRGVTTKYRRASLERYLRKHHLDASSAAKH